MGCGTSAHPPKRDTRAHSQVTVAAQQRAEAAYRRQRMAQEREQTAVLRAELEVERARTLKEMTGGSRRPSYCLELEDLKEETPDGARENLDECLKDYSVEAKNAKNSLSNGYSRSAVILKSESRGENVEQQNSQERVRANDENENLERKRSTGEHNDQDTRIAEKHDLLQTIKDRSEQASPSNVRIEENEQVPDHSGNDNEALEPVNAGIMDRGRESNEPQDKSITGNTDASQDQAVKKPANNCNDIITSANEDLSMTHENSTTNDENQQNPEGLEQVQDTTNNVNSGGSDTEPVKMADDLNTGHILSLHGKKSVEENDQQQHEIEHSKNIDNGSDQTEPIDVSTNQESVKREHEDTDLDVSNVAQEVTTRNQTIDQL